MKKYEILLESKILYDNSLKMKKRTFVKIFCSMFLLPYVSWTKNKFQNKLLIKNGWLFKDEDI